MKKLALGKHGGHRRAALAAIVFAAGALITIFDVHFSGGLALGPVLLYNRLDRDVSLNNDTRRRVFNYVKHMPGACIADVAGGVGISHSTASYHLDKLCGFNLVTQTADGNKVRFFLNGGIFTEEERRALAVLDNTETRRVLLALLHKPGSYRAELTTVLGVSSPTVNWHLDRLNSCNLVREQRSGRNRYLSVDNARLTHLLDSLLEKVADTGYDNAGLQSLRGALPGRP